MLEAVPIHEFWLASSLDPNKLTQTYRVSLGELIPERMRKTYRISSYDRPYNQSGSIGFMDLTIREHLVPKEGVSPIPASIENDVFRPHFLAKDYEIIQALTILVIGIESSYRRRGYARFLVERAEDLAMEWGLGKVVADSIQNDHMRKFHYRNGYTLYHGGSFAVIRLPRQGLKMNDSELISDVPHQTLRGRIQGVFERFLDP